MAGLVKRKYNKETINYKKGFTRQLKRLSKAFPYEYDINLILDLYKDYFPLEWEKLINRFKYYEAKDLHLKSIGKKVRYCHENPEQFILNLPKVKHLSSKGQIKIHQDNYSQEEQRNAIKLLIRSRESKIKKENKKSKSSNELLQNIEPAYIEIFIASYHKKNVTTQDKIEIINELKKYRCEKTIEFLQKINDSEKNNQVRYMAFEHLQKIGAHVRLRKKFKGKTKSYMIEKSDFIVTPEMLVARLEADTVQNKKNYDVFISHSYSDFELIKAVRKGLNKIELNIYCDWTSDNDFLKRNLAGEFTKIVLKKRIEQSKCVIFIQTKKSLNTIFEFSSPWIEMEISHAKKVNKPIYCLNFNHAKPKFTEIFFTSSGEDIIFPNFVRSQLNA